MKKFLIISAVFIVLVLGLVAQHNDVEREEVQVVPNTVETVHQRLTKSEKIEQNYQPSQDIGEIPVIFEQMVVSESLKPTEKSPAVASQLQIVPSTLSPKTEPNMNESMNLLVSQVAEQMMPYDSLVQASPDMGMYPYDMVPAQSHQQPRAMKPVELNNSEQISPDEVAVSQQHEPELSRHSKRSHHVAPDSYQSSKTNSVVAEVAPVQQPVVEPSISPEVEWVAQPSLLGRVKNGLSRIPKWLYGLPLVAGAYAMMKKAPVQLEDSVKPESEKIDGAGHVHDKLQELQDEYLNKEDQQPTSEPVQEIASVVSEPVPAKEVQPEISSTVVPEVAAKVVPESVEHMSSPASEVGGMFSSTRKLLSPVRSFDQLPEVSVPVVETAVVPTTSVACVVEPERGVVRKAMSDCYSYFAKRISSPIGVLALATKAATIGMQIAPLAYAARHAQLAHAEDMMLEGAIAQVARGIKPVDLPMVATAVTPVEGGLMSSYAAQLAAGNTSVIAGQFAVQCAKLRLH